jgi:hypothetical protein
MRVIAAVAGLHVGVDGVRQPIGRFQARRVRLQKRGLLYFFAPLVIPILANCSGVIGAFAVKEARENYEQCMRDVKASPEGQIFRSRMWIGDGADTVEKLTDRKPLTKDEKNAVLRYQNKLMPCRQIIIAHDNRYAAWETPYWQEFFQRADLIRLKLVSDEITVGVANRLSIESIGKFQVDTSKGQADATRVAQEQQQRAAEVMLASLPTTTRTTTNCYWAGNNLNCDSVRN